MRIHWLQHASFEGLGSIEEWAKHKGHSLSLTQLWRDEEPPGEADFDALIIMGGPMSVNEEAEYPWLAQEKAFIKAAITSDKPVLGICLGAQLIANVLGAAVNVNSQREIGWFHVTKTEAGKSNPVTAHLPERFMTFHWHGDTFDLPEGAVLLAYSAATIHQAFAIGEKVLGLQFHMEMTKPLLADMILHGSDELVFNKYVQTQDEIIIHLPFIHQNSEWLFGILEKLFT